MRALVLRCERTGEKAGAVEAVRKSHDEQFCKLSALSALSASHLSREAFPFLLNLNIFGPCNVQSSLSICSWQSPPEKWASNSFSQASGCHEKPQVLRQCKVHGGLPQWCEMLFWTCLNIETFEIQLLDTRKLFPIRHIRTCTTPGKFTAKSCPAKTPAAAKLGPPCLQEISPICTQFLSFSIGFVYVSLHEATLYLDIVHHAFITVVSIQEDHVQEVWPEYQWKHWKHTSNRWDAAWW